MLQRGQAALPVGDMEVRGQESPVTLPAMRRGTSAAHQAGVLHCVGQAGVELQQGQIPRRRGPLLPVAAAEEGVLLFEKGGGGYQPMYTKAMPSTMKMGSQA